MKDVPPINVTENSDGSFTLEWDETHPNFAFLNNMTEQEINDWFTNAIREGLDPEGYCDDSRV